MSPRRGADAHGDALGIIGGTVMRLGHRSTRVVLASAIATLAIASLASAQERAGVVTTLKGKVTVVRASSSKLTPLKFRDAVFVRDRITTGKDSFARVLLGGKAVVTIREFSAVTITEVPGVATVDVGGGRVEPRARPRPPGARVRWSARRRTWASRQGRRRPSPSPTVLPARARPRRAISRATPTRGRAPAAQAPARARPPWAVARRASRAIRSS